MRFGLHNGILKSFSLKQPKLLLKPMVISRITQAIVAIDYFD
jgi:hypothetical protein